MAARIETPRLQFMMSPREGSSYTLVVNDAVSDITLKPMGQATLDERIKLLDIRNRNEKSYGSGAPVDRIKFLRRLDFETERFKITLFSSFVIYDAGGSVLGCLGIGQGYAPDEVDLLSLRDRASSFGLTPDEIYTPSNNETQIGVLLSPEAYRDQYKTIKHIGIRVAQFLIREGLEKPLNAGEEDYFSRKRAIVDRWTFTIIDTKKLSAGDLPPDQRELLEFKQSQIEALEAAGIVKNLGYLLPASVDRRNYAEQIRIVYGKA